MRFTQKTRSILRYCAAFALIFGAVTLGERSKAVDGASLDETFEGDTIRCIINLGNENYGRNGFRNGFNYEMLEKFADAAGAEIEIVATDRHSNCMDSLKYGSVDILVLPDTCKTIGTDIILSRKLDQSVWALKTADIEKIKEINTWIVNYSRTDDYLKVWYRYHKVVNPLSRLAKGMTSSQLSPYDRLIKQYSRQLGWDWRMLAAVIYQESRFSINTVSHRGATGLMQVMPSTGRIYGVENLFDPEENIKAGTSHLRRLQKMYKSDDMDTFEQFKFVLAAYNAGEGRIGDCRNLAASENLNSNKWSDIVKVIPSMREDAILEKDFIRFGKFNGTETMNYVDNVIDIYFAFCEICPA